MTWFEDLTASMEVRVNGVALPKRAAINFVGGLMAGSDDAAHECATVTVTGTGWVAPVDGTDDYKVAYAKDGELVWGGFLRTDGATYLSIGTVGVPDVGGLRLGTGTASRIYSAVDTADPGDPPFYTPVMMLGCPDGVSLQLGGGSPWQNTLYECGAGYSHVWQLNGVELGRLDSSHLALSFGGDVADTGTIRLAHDFSIESYSAGVGHSRVIERTSDGSLRIGASPAISGVYVDTAGSGLYVTGGTAAAANLAPDRLSVTGLGAANGPTFTFWGAACDYGYQPGGFDFVLGGGAAPATGCGLLRVFSRNKDDTELLRFDSFDGLQLADGVTAGWGFGTTYTKLSATQLQVSNPSVTANGDTFYFLGADAEHGYIPGGWEFITGKEGTPGTQKGAFKVRIGGAGGPIAIQASADGLYTAGTLTAAGGFGCNGTGAATQAAYSEVPADIAAAIVACGIMAPSE